VNTSVTDRQTDTRTRLDSITAVCTSCGKNQAVSKVAADSSKLVGSTDERETSQSVRTGAVSRASDEQARLEDTSTVEWNTLSRGSMSKQNYFKEFLVFYFNMKPRLKSNKIILAAETIIFISFQT